MSFFDTIVVKSFATAGIIKNTKYIKKNKLSLILFSFALSYVSLYHKKKEVNTQLTSFLNYLDILLKISSFPKTCIISYKSGVLHLPVKVTLITVDTSPTCAL